MKLALAVPIVLLATALASPSWAADVDAVPVKDKPNVVEKEPTAHGAWLGWTQNSAARPDHFDFYVQRGSGARIKVNAPRTQSLDGAIAGHYVYYAQQLGDRAPRIQRYDLRTGKRTPVRRSSPLVSEDVDVSWPWLMYVGWARSQYGGDRTVVLHNLVTHRERTITSRAADLNELYLRQLNGSYAIYSGYNRALDPEWDTVRYDIGSKQYEDLQPSPSKVMGTVGVSSDGAAYYFQSSCGGYPCMQELVRHAVDGPTEVIATWTADAYESHLSVRFVKDRPDGSRVLYLTRGNEDILTTVDDPQAGD